MTSELDTHTLTVRHPDAKPGRSEARRAANLQRRARRRPLMNPLLLTPEEVADALHVGRTKVYDLLRSRTLASVKIGGCRRIPAAELRAYVERLSRQVV